MKPSKRVNSRLLVAIVAVILVTATTVAVVHRVQVHKNAAGLANLARAKLDEGKSGEAIGLFARYLTFRPNDAVALAEYARLMVARAERPDASRGDRLAAYDAVEAAVSKNQTDRELRATLANLMIRSGRFGAAGAQLDILLQDDAPPAKDTTDDGTVADDRSRLKLMRARAYIGTARWQEAATLLAEICGFDLETKTFSSTKAEPRTKSLVFFQSAVFLSAVLEEKLRDRDSGSLILDHLVEVNADDFRSWLARANWHRSHDDYAKAAEDLDKARAIAPDNDGVLFTSFEIAIAQQRFAEAETLVQRARGLFPTDERVYRGMATVAAKQGETERAMAVLREAMAAKLNDFYRVHLMLVDLLLQQGLLEQAEQEIARCGEKYGADSPDVALLEARLLLSRRRWLPAKKRLESIRPLVATSSMMTNQVDLYLGQCHEQLGEFDEQLAANRRVLSDDHTSLMARVGAAAALATTGRPDDALAEYEAIAASMPPDKLAATPQVWTPLMQLRVAQQLKRPAEERDWSLADKLLDLLEQSPAISSTQMALLKSDASLRRGDATAAEQLLQAQREIDPQNAQLTAALLATTLRSRGAAAALSLLETAPPEVVDSPLVMMAEAQIAARLSSEESERLFAAIEAQAEQMPDEEAAQLLAAVGAVRRNMGNPAEAERLWLVSLRKRPDLMQILAALLEIAQTQGNVEKAASYAADICRLAGRDSPQGRVANAVVLVTRVQQQQLERQTGRTGDSQRLAIRSDDVTPTAAEKEQLTAAYNLLIEAENDRPGWVRIQKLFAEIAGLRGDVPEAIERLRRATRMGPVDPLLLRQLLSLLYLSNRLEEAQQTLATLGPDEASGLERLSAEIELSAGKFDDAVALAERSIASTDKPAADDLRWFGQVLARAGKQERATEVLQRAVDTDPRQPEGWLALLSSQFTAGQRRAVERTLEKARASLEPPTQQAVLAQGSELLGRIDDAERYFREAVAADPRDTNAARNLASFLVRRGRLAAARDELRRIIAGSGDDPRDGTVRSWARRTLAVLLSQSGGYRGMEESLTLLEQNGDHGTLPPEDLVIMIDILAKRAEPSNWRRAIDLLDQLATRQPLSNAQRIQRAQLLEQCGRWDEARNELVSIVSRPGTPLVVQSMLIEKLIEHGERDTARAWLKKLKDRTADPLAVYALQAKLAVAENDRATAAEAAGKLMPDEVPVLQPEQIGRIASLLEQLGFEQAADKAFAAYAADNRAGVMARAGFLGRQHRADEALDILEQQWDRLPLLPLLQTAVLVLRSQGINASEEQRQRVAAWFVKADRQDPDSARVKLLQAELHSLNGRNDSAAAMYRDLLGRQDLSPFQSAVVANNLAFLLAYPATAGEAEQLIAVALEELGPSPDVLDTRGLVLLAAGKTREAVADLKEAVLSPTVPKYIHLARALVADGQIEDAAAALAAAKKLGLDPLTLSADDRIRLSEVEGALAR